MPRLQVMVGPDRFHMEPCRVNDSHRPHEIDTEHWVGRVLVRIVDAPGARQGEEGREYFKDRSRKFCIQLEGRFKKPWNGDEILFGSDFDKMIDFPRAPFNAGMRVAKYIDPCTFYEESPPSGRPYIMSPYCACMNTLCAWPAPSRAHDAVVVLRHTHGSASGEGSSPIVDAEKSGDAHSQMVAPASPVDGGDGSDGEEDMVPVETLAKQPQDSAVTRNGQSKRRSWFGGGVKKEQRMAKKYWRFVGFKQEARVRALLEAHNAKLREGGRAQKEDASKIKRQGSLSSNSSSLQPPSRPGSPAIATDVQHGHHSTHPTLTRLGTAMRLLKHDLSPSDAPSTPVTGPAQMAELGDVAGLEDPVGSRAPSPAMPRPVPTSAAPTLTSDPNERPQLERITTTIRREIEAEAKTDGLHDGDFKLADALAGVHVGRRTSRNGSETLEKGGGGVGGAGGGGGGGAGAAGEWHSKLDEQLGPWRFSDAGTDMIEDNAFIFTTKSVDVKTRRKHFAVEQNRKNLKYDPDVVYATSFFTDACDLNTLNLALGPVRINVSRFFKDMPVRYTLRAANDENVTFCTISFQLVD